VFTSQASILATICADAHDTIWRAATSDFNRGCLALAVVAQNRDYISSKGSAQSKSIPKSPSLRLGLDGAGDRGRTGDVQLGNESEQGNPGDDGEKEA
jgi:hypothetical protein